VPNVPRKTPLDLQEVTTRNDAARQIIAGFAATLPTLADYWRTIDTALSDTADLAATLARTRLDYADLLAAARATLGARNDGEDDPLSYLRDELHEQAQRRAGR
jgi:ABC-type transporter Mla subunit MlaD